MVSCLFRTKGRKIDALAKRTDTSIGPRAEADVRRAFALQAVPGVETIAFEGVAQSFPAHFHEFWTIGAIARGRRRTTCSGATLGVGPGDAVLFAPGEAHGCMPADGEALSYRSVTVPDAVLARALGREAGSLRPSRFAVRDAALVRAVDAVCALAADPGADALAQEEALAVLAARVAARCEDPRACGKATANAARAGVERARALLEERCVEGVALSELAEAAGLSRCHLVRAFSARTGLTPHRYLQALRANRARRLIADGLAPSQAAARSGFSDQAHMTRVFKALFGLTPARYRASVERRRRA